MESSNQKFPALSTVSHRERQTMNSNMKVILKGGFLVSVAAFLLSGCGGGGDSGGGGGSPPVISSLTYTPQSALTTSGSINVSGKASFTSDADVVSLRFTDSRGADSTVPVSAAGIRNGTASVPASKLTLTTTEAYQFTVWLVDSAGRTSNRLVGSIAITAPAPVANAGADFVGTTGTPISLDGSSSVNSNGTSTTYSWTLSQKPATSNAILSGVTTAKPSFTPDKDGVYQVQLTVNDGLKSSGPAAINIKAIPAGYVTLGSPQSQASAVLGTPTTIHDTANIYGYNQWDYGANYIRLKPPTNTISSWDNHDGKLKVILIAGNNTTTATKISLGSSMDDVIKIQGTPTTVHDTVSIYGYNEWDYGSDSIRFSPPTFNVSSWNNSGGRLLVQ